jgi:hypothetical protein
MDIKTALEKYSIPKEEHHHYYTLKEIPTLKEKPTSTESYFLRYGIISLILCILLIYTLR